MSAGVLFDRESARRIRDAVRTVEAGRVPQGAGVRQHSRTYVQITAVVGSGEYQCTKVKRDASAWVIVDGDLFNDGDINVFELNGEAGLTVGTVVEVFALYDTDTGAVFWTFGAAGGAAGYDGPFKVSKVNSTTLRFYATATAVRPDMVTVGQYGRFLTSGFFEGIGFPLPVSGTEIRYAWLRISQQPSGVSAGDPIVNREVTTALPTFSDQYNTILLATVEVDPTGIVAIRQDQQCHINIPATIVEYDVTNKLIYRQQNVFETDIVQFEECTP